MVSLSAWNLARAHLSIRIQVCQTIPAPSAPPPPTWPDCSAPGPAVLVGSRDSLLLLLQSHVMTS